MRCIVCKDSYETDRYYRLTAVGAVCYNCLVDSDEEEKEEEAEILDFLEDVEDPNEVPNERMIGGVIDTIRRYLLAMDDFGGELSLNHREVFDKRIRDKTYGRLWMALKKVESERYLGYLETVGGEV
jgi:hypothetical protein